MNNWESFIDRHYLSCALLAYRINGVNKIVGSATYLAPGLYLTARHVVEEPVKAQGDLHILREIDNPGGQTNTEMNFEIDLIHVLKNQTPLVCRIRKVTLVPKSDVAVLVGLGYDGQSADALVSRLPTTEIDLHPPEIGERLMSIGYSGKLKSANVSLGGTKTSHNAVFEAFAGETVAVHFQRESVAPPPCIEVAYPIKHSMSGGPTFNNAGRIVGINSSGLGPESTDGQDRSIISMLWKPIVASFTIPPDSNAKTSLLELARQGSVKVWGLNRFSYEGDQIRWL